MTFTGPLTVGGPNVTLTGTAESIWGQLLEKNPNYDPWAFPEYQSRMAAKGITREMMEGGTVSLLKSKSGLVKRDRV
jgi:hypothetical protein